MISRSQQLSSGFSMFAFLLLAGVAAARTSAQCATQWLQGQGIPGTNGHVAATTMWDPDGPGPRQPVLVLGGGPAFVFQQQGEQPDFTIAGTVLANRIASYDPVSRKWSTLGSGSDAPVSVLTTLANGDLVAGGQFLTAGGVTALIARWDGVNWLPLGSGTNGRVNALTKLPNGDLVAAGEFTMAGGVAANHVARWNGTSWSALGSGVAGTARALAVLPNGDIVAGFSVGVGDRIERWDGTSWSPLGSGMDNKVYALATMPNSDVVAGGEFTTAGGVAASFIARWDGTSWSPLGAGLTPWMGWPWRGVRSLLVLPGGDLVAGGDFSSPGNIANIARWNGSSWSALAGLGLTGAVLTLTTLPNGHLVAGGDFISASGATFIARWDGTSWSQLGSGLDNMVLAVMPMPDGDLVVGGRFSRAGTRRVNHIARWNGATWSRLGSGVAGAVHALTTLSNGDLVAGGTFTSAGGMPAGFVARWDGTSWSALPGLAGGHPGYDGVWALTTLPNGDLVAGGNFTAFTTATQANNIARWNGTSWSALGAWAPPAIDNGVWALTTLPNGDLVAAGQFNTAGGVSAKNIARWDGTTWSAMGSGPLGPGVTGFTAIVPTVWALTTLSNGDLVAGGYFYYAGGVYANCVARWNGASWSPFGSGIDFSPVISVGGYGHGYSNGVWSLATLPNGDLVAGGRFTAAGGGSANHIARWDGTNWSPLGSGIGGGLQFKSVVTALKALPNADLVAGGSFTMAGDGVSAYLAQLTTTCPASTVSAGAGCIGSGGLNVLTATSLPWTGSTFTSLATGMPSNALALGVLGTSTASVPLSSILPQGVAGCTLLVSPGQLELLLPSTGSVALRFAIPNTTALAGQIVHQQVVPIELDLQGNIVALTSTNALRATIGVF